MENKTLKFPFAISSTEKSIDTALFEFKLFELSLEMTPKVCIATRKERNGNWVS
jgi:hypothetical protein